MPSNTDNPIIEYWSSDECIQRPEGLLDVKRKWRCEIMAMDEDNLVHEFEVSIVRPTKLKLTDTLQVLANLWSDLRTSNPSFNFVEFGLRLY